MKRSAETETAELKIVFIALMTKATCAAGTRAVDAVAATDLGWT